MPDETWAAAEDRERERRGYKLAEVDLSDGSVRRLGMSEAEATIAVLRANGGLSNHDLLALACK